MARPTQAVDPFTSAAQRYRQMQRWHGPDSPEVREAGRELAALKAARHLDQVREHVRRSRAEQGLSPTASTDEMTLRQVAELVGAPAHDDRDEAA